MTTKADGSETMGWSCFQCGGTLEIGSVNIDYMEFSFPVNVPRCPHCGVAYISEELATGKMAEVEKILEDK